MKKLLVLPLLLLTGLSQAGSLDMRLSYDATTKEYAGRVFVSNVWESGWGASVDVPFNMTQTKYSGDVDKLVTGTNEFTLYKNFKLSPEVFVRPGLSVQVTKDGSTSRPWVTVGRKMNDKWDTSLRYRYNNKNFDTKDLAGVMDRDNAHNLTFWNGYKVNSWLTMEYQLDYIRKVNNYANDNKKKVIFENELVALFPNAFGKGITPYVLIDHLGSVKNQSGAMETHWRPRAGLKVAF
jgi:hypothetical protein